MKVQCRGFTRIEVAQKEEQKTTCLLHSTHSTYWQVTGALTALHPAHLDEDLQSPVRVAQRGVTPGQLEVQAGRGSVAAAGRVQGGTVCMDGVAVASRL